MEQSEQYNRRDNLIITGITTSYAETAGSERREVKFSSKTIEKVITFCKDVLDSEVQDIDISTAYCITSKKTTGHPPILVHFSRRVVRDDILQARFKLKEYNKDLDRDEMVFNNEDLVDFSKKLLNAAKEQVRAKNLLGVWTKIFRVIIKPIGKTPTTLTSHAQLRTLVVEAQEEDDAF